MNIKGFRRMLFGEKMPDKNDPQYKERYERDVEAGRRFARATRIDKAAARVQRFADMHRTLFLAIVFGFVAAALAWNIYRLAVVYRHQSPTATSLSRCILMMKLPRSPQRARLRRCRIRCCGSGTKPCKGTT